MECEFFAHGNTNNKEVDIIAVIEIYHLVDNQLDALYATQ